MSTLRHKKGKYLSKKKAMERIALAATIGFGAFKAMKEFLKLSDEEHEFSAIAGPPGGRQNRKEFFGLGVSEFLNDDRLLIAYRSWIPPSITKGVVIISHGFAGHVGRYEHVALELQRHGFAVYAIDHVGHGQSEGDRAYVKHFSNYSRDLIQLTRMVKNVHEDQTNFFLIGHSMGGAIAIKTVFQEPKLFNAVVLSGPLIEPDPKVATPVMKTLARLVSNLLPKMSLDSVEADKVSEDPIVVNRYVNDPLVYVMFERGVRVEHRPTRTRTQVPRWFSSKTSS